MINVLNVNTSLDLEVGGGTAERTFQMSRFLAKQENFKCTVLTLDIDSSLSRTHALLPADSVALPYLWRRFYLPHIKWRIIKRLVANSDVIHLMGHWSVLNYLVYLAARQVGKPYVVCPAGALPIFGRSAILKRIYNFVAGRAIIKNASAWIAVTTSEILQYEKYGITASKVSIIPNGVNEADFPVIDSGSFLSKFKLPDVPFILFMGRLNKIKGPDLLMQAFIEVSDQIADFHLIFVGPDGGLLEKLISMAAHAGVERRVHFLGYLSGSDKNIAYRAAHLMVVPSRQEAMSIVAIEAGICGTPVMLTDQCGFSSIRKIDKRLETPATVDGLASSLMQLLDKPEFLNPIASQWAKFVKEEFTWDAMGPKYIDLYKKIVYERREMPTD